MLLSSNGGILEIRQVNVNLFDHFEKMDMYLFCPRPIINFNVNSNLFPAWLSGICYSSAGRTKEAYVHPRKQSSWFQHVARLRFEFHAMNSSFRGCLHIWDIYIKFCKYFLLFLAEIDSIGLEHSSRSSSMSNSSTCSSSKGRPMPSGSCYTPTSPSQSPHCPNSPQSPSHNRWSWEIGRR